MEVIDGEVVGILQALPMTGTGDGRGAVLRVAQRVASLECARLLPCPVGFGPVGVVAGRGKRGSVGEGDLGEVPVVGSVDGPSDLPGQFHQ